MPAPTASLSHLHRADGSATYSHNGYTIIGSVNGPIEVQRRDELPEESAIEVNIRPGAGVGSPKERHLESIIHSVLRSVISVKQFPRSLIQLTLQIINLPENEGFGSRTPSSILPLLPSLLQTSVLTLLSASIPLRTAYTSVLVAATPTAMRHDPSPKEVRQASSLHVFAFSLRGELLLCESEGSFELEEWDNCYEVAEGICRRTGEGMELEDRTNLEQWIRGVVKEKIDEEQSWRTGA